ncbi:hypothetical protein OQA88_4278 [Cercophora sp. LCS_1]
MNSKLPSKDELMARTTDELPITQDEASRIAAAESDMTGRGPIKGGPAAIAQSLHDKQKNFLAKASEVAHKSADEITKEDAAEVQRSETRLLGHPPGEGSISAKIQAITDHNANKSS